MKQVLASAVGAIFAAADTATSTGGAAAKPPKFCDKSWNEEGVVTFKFGNGTVLEFDTKKVNDETRLDLTCHGASQKIGDSFAGVKGNFAEGISNAQGVIDQLYANEWNADREGGGPRLAELAAAIARIKGVPLEKATAAVTKGTEDQRKAWRSNPGVKHAIAQLRAEKAAAALEAAQSQNAAGDIEVDFSDTPSEPQPA